ncbi:MAG TPA: hypothetical protein PLD20_05630 [Blastocatellia bacterium]|nr:hypothetical protein [Blastocatellia bacterium]HMX27930.1 hypothetical protein [Blastocatellia bacterium]HMZ17387.1 hypothetical protein [Blastocatellia bacterium]HNG29241.1 hypothetical protein [Blastocatellia bacterium]
MNPVAVSIVVAAVSVVTLILAIFGASWLLQNNLKQYIDARIDALRAEIETVRVEVGAVRNEMRAEFASQGNRLERVERQLDAIFKPILPKSGD